MKDRIYQQRFVKCLMNHYQEMFEIYIYEDFELLVEETDLAILAEGLEETELELLAKQNKWIYFLREDANEVGSSENIIRINKYQEVYRIMEHIEASLENGGACVKEENGRKVDCEIIGVMSFSNEILQLPFSAMAAMICGEKEKTLLIDLQAFSGLIDNSSIENEDTLGMEDLMSIATTGIYTKSRLMSAIGHEQKWDYVRPVTNTECLVEANADIYRQMISLLAKELNYKKIILNFGTAFSGMFDLLGRCDKIFCLTSKAEMSSWRECAFLGEIGRRGKSDIWKKVSKIEVLSTQTRDWPEIAQKWIWTEIGDTIRERLWVEI